MKHYIYSIAFILSITAFSFGSFGQYSVTSKTCGACSKEVSSTARVGQTCPHCHVKWGYENTKTENINTYSQNNRPISYNYEPSDNSTYASQWMYQQSNVIRVTNLRAGPSPKAEIMMQLEKNESVTITKIVGDWVKVTYIGRYNGKIDSYRGWVHISNVVL